MRFSRVLPVLLLAGLTFFTFATLQADPTKRRKSRTRTPTPAAAETTPTAAPARPAGAAPASPAARAPAASPTSAPPAPPTKTAAVAPAGASKADVDAGKALYDKFCKKCHGAEGEGVARMYQLADARIVPLGSKQAQSKSDAQIKKAMLEGIGKMEAVEDLTPQQADKILAFERTLH